MSENHIPGVEGEMEPGVKEDVDVLRLRRWIGYGLGALSILSIVSALAVSLFAVRDLTPSKDIQFDYVRLATHAVVVIAWVWFSYQLLRAAERLIIPYWWLRNSLEAVKVLLGMTDPWRAALRTSRDVLDLGGKVAQVATEKVAPSGGGKGQH